jgi:hypothetical protein
MRKHLVLLCAVFALFACGKFGPEVETPEVSEISVSDIVFDFTVKYPVGTKASKQGWESGDAVFVFFEDYTGFFVKLTYNGSEWVSSIGPEYAFMPGTMTTEGKTVTAVYRPFGSDATPKYGVGGWYFPETQYTYYMAAEKEKYTFEKVSGQWVLTATLNMLNPEGYVQFFIEDGEAIDGGYTLGCDAVIPVGIASIGEDGTITETSDKTAADDMLGYAYNGGYLFSGKLTAWDYGSNYYFAKTKTADGTRADYFVSGKTLTSHAAVKLPASGSDQWVAVGSGNGVLLKKADNSSLGTWKTCNLGASVPEETGPTMSYYTAITRGAPNKEQIQALVDNCSWTWLTIHGQQGAVGKASTGFLFLPIGLTGYYFSSTESFGDFAWGIHLKIGEGPYCIDMLDQEDLYPVRSLQK